MDTEFQGLKSITKGEAWFTGIWNMHNYRRKIQRKEMKIAGKMTKSSNSMACTATCSGKVFDGPM